MPTPSENSRIPVEPVVFETLDWKPSVPEMYSRAEVVRQTGSYKAAITAKIGTWELRFSGAEAADVEDATRQLVEFDKYAQRMLGTDNPALGPMTAILLRTESASSSQIEQLTTSARQLALAEIGEGEKANALTVIGNVRAMEAALELAAVVNERTILTMHRELMAGQIGLRQITPGAFRKEQVWIGPGLAGPRRAHFVPPHHGRLSEAMTDLVRFMQREDLPVLVQMAVAHAQFETIHPFSDGNGRTGRALSHALLRNKGVISSTTVPISAGLLVELERYFAALDKFQNGDAGPIIREFAAASRIAVTTGTRLVEELAAQLNKSRAMMQGLRADSLAWQILPHLIAQPAVNAKYLVETLGIGEMAALRALNALTERGVIAEMTGKARGRVWQHKGVLGTLDEYAARLRRLSASRANV